MSENVYFAFFLIPPAAFVLVSLMKYAARVLEARAQNGHEAAYRAVAAQATQAQADTAAAIAAQGALLADIQGRLAGLEKILRQVE